MLPWTSHESPVKLARSEVEKLEKMQRILRRLLRDCKERGNVMISHTDTMTTSIDEHSVGVVESLIKGNPLYNKHVQHAAPEFLPGHLLAIHLRLSPLLILQQHIKTRLGQLAGLL